MRKIHKIPIIFLIFILINALFLQSAYASDICLRVPLINAKYGFDKTEAMRRIINALDSLIQTRSSEAPSSPYSEFLKQNKGMPMPLVSNKLSAPTLGEIFNLKDREYYHFYNNRRFYHIVRLFGREEYGSPDASLYGDSLFKKRLENPLRDKKRIEASLRAISSLNELSGSEIDSLSEHINAYNEYIELFAKDWNYVQKKGADSELGRFIFSKGLVFLGEAISHLESISGILKGRDFYNADNIISDKRLYGIREYFRKFQNTEKDLSVKDRHIMWENASDFWKGVYFAEKGKKDLPERVADFEKLKNSLSRDTVYYLTHGLPNSLKSRMQELEFYMGGVRLIRSLGFSICNGTEEAGIIDLKDAWNPIAGDSDEMQKLDIEVGLVSDFLGITGPNEIGKTTILKTAAICVLFYHMGLPVPAGAESVIGVFKNIYTVIPETLETGDQELIRIKARQKLAELKSSISPRDLVLIDESTISSDHDALAKETADILKEIISRGATVIYATHLKDTMRLLKADVPDAKLQQLVYEEKDGNKKRVFKPGIAETSELTETLKNAGYPESIIKWTEEYYNMLKAGSAGALTEFKKTDAYADMFGRSVNIFGFKETDPAYRRIRENMFPEGIFYFELNAYMRAHWDWDTSMGGRKEYIAKEMEKWMSVDLSELEAWRSALGDIYDSHGVSKEVFEDSSMHYYRSYRDERPGKEDLTGEEIKVIDAISERIFNGKADADNLLSMINEIDFFLNIAIESKRKGFNCLKETKGGKKITLNNMKDPFSGETVSINLGLNKKVNLLLENGKDGSSFVKIFNSNLIMNHTGLPVMTGQGSKMPEFGNVLVFIGGEENMQEGKSYFRAIAENLAAVVKNAGPDSLVLIDTLQGSDYWELSAFQLALIRYFNQAGSTVILSTNMTEGLERAGDTISYNIITEKAGKYTLKTSINQDSVIESMNSLKAASTAN